MSQILLENASVIQRHSTKNQLVSSEIEGTSICILCVWVGGAEVTVTLVPSTELRNIQDIWKVTCEVKQSTAKGNARDVNRSNFMQGFYFLLQRKYTFP